MACRHLGLPSFADKVTKEGYKRSGSSTKGDLLQKDHSLTLVFEKSSYQEKCYIKNTVQETKKQLLL